eukprot:5680129-Pleurochrysis_carterae.AAC.2
MEILPHGKFKGGYYRHIGPFQPDRNPWLELSPTRCRAVARGAAKLRRNRPEKATFRPYHPFRSNF